MWIFLGMKILSIFPNQNLDVGFGFGMLEETLILCSQEITYHFSDFFF
jgi:hypothetical protein